MKILAAERALRTATGLAAVAAGFAVATAGPANAAGGSAVAQAPTVNSVAANRSGPVMLSHHGARAQFPTWVWGATRLCVHNVGWSGDGEARVQTWLGADPEYLPVTPGQTRCVRRWWGGVPITVTNTKYAPLTVWTE